MDPEGPGFAIRTLGPGRPYTVSQKPTSSSILEASLQPSKNPNLVMPGFFFIPPRIPLLPASHLSAGVWGRTRVEEAGSFLWLVFDSFWGVIFAIFLWPRIDCIFEISHVTAMDFTPLILVAL